MTSEGNSPGVDHAHPHESGGRQWRSPPIGGCGRESRIGPKGSGNTAKVNEARLRPGRLRKLPGPRRRSHQRSPTQSRSIAAAVVSTPIAPGARGGKQPSFLLGMRFVLD